jgi:hypothetical protein
MVSNLGKEERQAPPKRYAQASKMKNAKGVQSFLILHF